MTPSPVMTGSFDPRGNCYGNSLYNANPALTFLEIIPRPKSRSFLCSSRDFTSQR
jgi:hypothetical protein